MLVSIPFSYAQATDLGLRPMFLKTQIKLTQDGQPDLNLQDLGFPTQRTALQASLALYTQNILLAYRLTPQISLGTEAVLLTPILMGSQSFGQKDASTTGENKPVQLDGSMWSNQLELTWKRNYSFQPSFLVELHSVNLHARQLEQDKIKEVYLSKTFYDVGAGAVGLWPMDPFIAIMKAYYLYNGTGNGFLLEGVIAYRNFGAGYLYRKQTYKSGNSGLVTSFSGPYLQVEFAF
jgi:hypothetical protein